ncbi:DegT/DnrJ/EryC1/StrS family aminotransferase [Maridesulfovibrio zosterae]|uniref:DegT/DnrJ/EryC1/StrS family aminotransferase n=1 Tax=Maridesulfovibrio zosterae TaxID=82171 RepID=UPI000404A51B|nr:DegT/DnrJ/EryC1/StrS family aminotransferase [Maridesulfovibrio zosterae]
MTRIPLIRPYISYSDVESDFKDIFESGWFTKGKFVSEFKHQIAEYTSSKYACTTTSATTALYACLRVLNIGVGDEVIVSDLSFPATANVVEEVGAVPIFADVSLDTFNMLPEELETKINSKTKAVIFVDAFGNLSGIDKIKSICRSHSIPLIEDAACAIGSSLDDIKSGNISDLTCFSFHPRKLLTCGEGGAITTNNTEYAQRIEVLLNHGAQVIDGKFDFIEAGYNFRMTEMQAAMGISQLKRLDAIVESRNTTKQEYSKLLEPLEFTPQRSDINTIHNVQSLVYRVPEGVSRDKLIHKLAEHNIETTLGTYCLSGLTYYAKKYGNINPNAQKLQNTTITLPCFEGVDVDRVIKTITKIL